MGILEDQGEYLLEECENAGGGYDHHNEANQWKQSFIGIPLILTHCYKFIIIKVLGILQDGLGDVQTDPDRLHDLEWVHVAKVVHELGRQTPGPVHFALGPEASVVGHQLRASCSVEFQVFVWNTKRRHSSNQSLRT